MNYQDINAKVIDLWCENGWQWGKAISHGEYPKALNGEWDVLLTTTKLCGLDNGINFIFDDTETAVKYKLPFNPLNNPQQYEESIKNDWGIQFSHTLEEQIGGQLEAGFVLTNLYEDTNGEGKLHEYNIPPFLATRAIKP